MKKVFSVLLVVTSLFALVGCGGKTENMQKEVNALKQSLAELQATVSTQSEQIGTLQGEKTAQAEKIAGLEAAKAAQRATHLRARRRFMRPMATPLCICRRGMRQTLYRPRESFGR